MTKRKAAAAAKEETPVAEAEPLPPDAFEDFVPPPLGRFTVELDARLLEAAGGPAYLAEAMGAVHVGSTEERGNIRVALERH